MGFSEKNRRTSIWTKLGLLLFLSVIIQTNSSAQYFSEQDIDNHQISELEYASFRAVDINGDGWMDVVSWTRDTSIESELSSNIYIQMNRNGVLTTQLANLQNLPRDLRFDSRINLEFYDADADNLLDVFMIDYIDNGILHFKTTLDAQGNPVFTFVQEWENPTNEYLLDLSFADVNADGFMDLISNAGLFINSGNEQTFELSYESWNNWAPGSYVNLGSEGFRTFIVYSGDKEFIRTGDFNQDGYVDVYFSTMEAVLLNNQGSGFEEFALPTGFFRPELADINQDGRLDIAGVRTDNYTFGYALNLENGFELSDYEIDYFRFVDNDVADLSGLGRPEFTLGFLISTHVDSVQGFGVVPNYWNSELEPHQIVENMPRENAVILDVNGDSKLDVLLSGDVKALGENYYIKYLQNRIAVANVAPAAPSAITVATNPNSPGSVFITFETPEQADQNQDYQLFYVDYDLMDMETGEYLTKALAKENGMRLSGDFGTFLNTGKITLQHLEQEKTYKIRVQFVDLGMKGSAFAELEFQLEQQNLLPLAQELTESWQNYTIQWANLSGNSNPEFIVQGELNGNGSTAVFQISEQNQIELLGNMGIPERKEAQSFWFDFNQDGMQDVLMYGKDQANFYELSVLKNSNGIFTPVATDGIFLDNVEPERLIFTDLTGKGRGEWLAFHPDNGLQVYEWRYEDEQLRFSLMEHLSLPVSASTIQGIQLADVNQNGKLEWLVIQTVNEQLDLVRFEQNEQGNWQELERESLLMSQLDLQKGMYVQELNETEIPEFVVYGKNSSDENVVKVFAYNSDLNAFEVIVQQTSSGKILFDFADVSLNGYPDFILIKEDAEQNPQFTINQNVANANGTRRFQEWNDGLDFVTPLKSGAVSVTDYNADGKPDIILSGYSSEGESKTTVYINNFVGEVQAASVPEQVTAMLQENNQVFIQWNTSNDAQSGNEALHYQLRIQDAETQEEYRIITTQENANIPASTQILPVFGTELMLSLPEGKTYSISVQSINASGVHSAFSQAVSVEVPYLPFAEIKEITNDISNGLARIVDVNADGFLDILQSGYGGFNFFESGVWLNTEKEDGSRSWDFQEMPSLPELGASRISFGDIDGDTKPDMLISGATSTGLKQTKVYQLFTQGVGYSWSERQELSGVIVGDSKFFDADNDGDLDLILTGSGLYGTVLELYLNTNPAPGTYRENPFELDFEAFSPAIGYDFSSVDVADVNQDGWLDVLISGNNYSAVGGRGLTTDIYMNSGGRFTLDEKASENLPENYHGTAKFADVNNDGFPDVLVVGREGAFLSIHQGKNDDGTIAYTTSALPIPASVGARFDVGDLNNDGFVDVIVSGREQIDGANTDPKRVWMLLNTGDESFELAPEKWTAGFPETWNGSVEMGDLNGDGSMDVVFAASDLTKKGRVFINQLHWMAPEEIHSNEQPEAPLRPQIISKNGVQKLTWSFGGDDHTSAKAMRYNIKMSSAEIGDNLIRSSVSEDGKPRFMTSGFAVNRMEVDVPEINPDEVYRWSVQAIDQSGKHSAWTFGGVINDEASQAAEYRSLVENGSVEKRINMVFIAEAWTENQREAFFAEAARMADSIVAISPYKEYRNFFNMHAIFVPSNDGEITYWNGNSTQERDTYFNAYRDNYNNPYYITIPNADGKNAQNLATNGSREAGDYADGFGKVDQLLSRFLPEYDLVVMLCKSNSLAGSAVLWQDRTIGFVGIPSVDAAGNRFKIARHELAHSLGLGDEYGASSNVRDHFQADFPNVFRASVVNRNTAYEEAPWAKWLTNEFNYLSFGGAFNGNATSHGLFEGGQYVDRNYFRAHYNDIMRDFTVNKFGPVNREWLIKAFYGYRWHVEGMPEPFHRIRPLHLIEDHTPNEELIQLEVNQSLELSTDLLIPSHGGGLQVVWRLDGEVVETVSSSIQIPFNELSSGVHQVSVHVKDITPYSDEIPAEAYNSIENRRWVIPANDELGYLSDEVEWTFTVPETVANEQSTSPTEFALHQNYPNPFNPSTQIRFSLAKAGLVRLEVFDAIGRKVAVLAENQFSAGTHSVQFSGHNLSSGIYFYTLKTEQQSLTRKMMLIK
ncbi:T9SS type A sorting domain-containing protein [bacterium]|nr:MAG: T9SS type A sorting domain-containing protein [bacterium]